MLEPVALLVCPTIGGIQELRTPDMRVDEGILGIRHQMANQCRSWKTKQSLGSLLSMHFIPSALKLSVFVVVILYMPFTVVVISSSVSVSHSPIIFGFLPTLEIVNFVHFGTIHK